MVMVTTIGTVTMMKVMLIKQQPEAQLKAAYQTATSFCRTIRIRSTPAPRLRLRYRKRATSPFRFTTCGVS